MSSLIEAIKFANVAHKGQKRKWTELPYIVHPCRVLARVQAVGGSLEMQMASVLHDTVEDCGVTYEELVKKFGKTVADYVLELTTPEIEGNRAARKAHENDRLSGISKEAKIIKLCDRIDNLWDMDPKSGWAKKYARESLGLLSAIGDAHEGLMKDLVSVIDRIQNA